MSCSTKLLSLTISAPVAGSLNTFNHATLWKYYCKPCRWGFGHPQEPRNYENER